jgi:hypothetical protein
VALIQELWVHGDQIRGLCNRQGTLFSAEPGIATRACIFVRNISQAFPLLELCSRDVTTEKLSFNRGGSIRELPVTSAYLPYDLDEPPPSRELRDIVTHCCRNNLLLITGSDANAHHFIWGCTGIKPTGHYLLEYLVSTNLNILNKGNKLTFVVRNEQKVIDLTLGTDKIGELVSNWHVSDETSRSDHRYILFQVCDLEISRITYHNPKRTNWESYWEDLKVNLGAVPRVVHLVRDVELAVNLVQQAILSSYHQN